MMQVPTQVTFDLTQIAGGNFTVYAANPKPSGFNGTHVLELNSDLQVVLWKLLQQGQATFGDVQVRVVDRYHAKPDFVPNPSEAEFAEMVQLCLDDMRAYHRQIAGRATRAIDTLDLLLGDQPTELHLEPLTA